MMLKSSKSIADFSILICFLFLTQFCLVAAHKLGKDDNSESVTVNQELSAMDRILAINSQARSGMSKARKREVVEDYIIKANDAEHVSDDLLEGDIILNPTRIPEDMEMYKLQQKRKSETYTSHETAAKRQATRNMKWLWHSKRVPYEISPTLDQVKHTILKAIRTFNSKTCVQFVPRRKSDRNYVVFDKRQGCYSRIGRSYVFSAPQIISIGKFCDYEDLIIHEMLHTVGFYHEQSRPDRQKYVKILWENVKPGFENEFLQYSHGRIDHLNINYNYKSLMHYGSRAFSKTTNLKTIIPIDNKHNVELGNTQMSILDVIELDALYRCKSSKVNEWTQWSSYSPCDASCYKQRQRFCYGQTHTSCGGNPSPYGVETKYLKCPTNECPIKIHGHWGEWSPWSSCSRSCNEGKKTRKRKCNNPELKDKGKSCSGSSIDEVMCVQPRCKLEFDDTDFRDGQLGMWENDIYDTPGLDWIIGRGDTPTEGTGPHHDHTSKDGFYLYVESSGRQEEDTARLTSKTLPPTSPNPKCFNFFYHMFGSSMGSLTVRMTSDDQAQKVLFTKSGSQNPGWKKASLTLNSAKSFQLVFEAVLGKQPYSDIAIDDVFLDDGSCDCRDRYMICKKWARLGYCKKAFSYMYMFCPRSCDFCGCKDNPSWNCKQWSLKECKKNPLWMEVTCPVTCHVCGCYDKSVWCHLWSRIGECSRNPLYMKVNCRKSCKFCT